MYSAEMEKKQAWTRSNSSEALRILRSPGGCVVSPTKVGYIVMAADRRGLERKFAAKQRNLNKPGVVLCGSMAELKVLADMNSEIEVFCQKHWDQDILLGCVLPWKSEARDLIPLGCEELMMDKRGTSCFVIKFGTPSEMIVRELWEDDRRLIFGSSANPSGKGNRGRSNGIGERIENEVDLIITADDYVASIQPGKDDSSRYEQGVMISMVDDNGKLIPEQKGQRQIVPSPILIRKGLDLDKITALLCESFNSWNYRHGQYY